MKINKKVLSLLLVIIMCFAVAGCGKDEVEVTSYEFSCGLPEQVELYPKSVGTTYYISKSGIASNDGLSPEMSKPFSAISSIKLEAGVSILLKRGDSFTGQITINNAQGQDNNPVTIGAYGEGDRPIVEYSGDVVSFSKSSNLVIKDLHVKVIGVDRTETLANTRTGIYGIYNYVGGIKYRNIYIVNNRVQGNGVAKNLMGIRVTNVENSFASSHSDVVTGLYVLGNEVSDLGRSGIYCNSWITNSTNGNNGKMTVYKDVHFDNNIVYNVGMMGIYILGGTNSTINRNLVYDTGMHETKQVGGEGMCGIMAVCADTMDIMYNVSYNNNDAESGHDAMAIDIDWNTKNINVQYNHVYNNEGSGIGTMACQNSFVRNNRVENNLCATNQTAQIQASDFTARYEAVAENMHATRNLKITNNLIVGTPKNKSMFRAQKFNGDSDWSGNEFTDNRVVYSGDDPNSIEYIFVDEGAPWYKFGNNRYFANDTSVFKCFDPTTVALINIGDGAEPYVFSKNFSSWAKRDKGSTLSTINNAKPSRPSMPSVTYQNSKLNLSWKKSSGNLYQYNIFLQESDEIDYRNLLGQTKGEAFSFDVEKKGEYKIVIRPESPEGNYGEDLVLTIVLN